MTRKTPQEKKALSYAKDRRNVYGENDKASRKGIPLAKARVNRANRHQVDRGLHEAEGPVDLAAADDVEQRVVGRRPQSWAKQPDRPLGDYLADRADRRSS